MNIGFSGLTLLAFVASAVPALAQSVDWTGFYGGISGAINDGTQDYDSDGQTDYDLEGPTFGIFAGHSWSNGPLIYGVELAASRGGVYEVSLDGETSYKDDYEFTRFVDLKGRVGYAMNSVLVYGTLGLSRTRFVENGATSTYDASGLIYGVGADYQIGARSFVGAEYTRRTYDVGLSGGTLDAEMDTLAFRLGMKF